MPFRKGKLISLPKGIIMSENFTASVNLFNSILGIYKTVIGPPDFEELEETFQFRFPDLNDPDQRVPLRVCYQIVDFMANKMSDPVFGLRWADYSRLPLRPNALKLFLGIHSLKQLIELIGRYMGLMTDGCRPGLECGPEKSYLRLNPRLRDYFGIHQASAQLAGLRKVIALVKPDALKAVHFEHECPQGCESVYQKAFMVPVYFGRPFDALEFNTLELKKQLPGSRPDPASLIDTELRLEQKNSIADLPKVTESVVSYFLEFGIASRDQTAEALGLSLRTMQRKLSQQQTSFKEILENVRYRKATQLLNIPGYSYEDIAFVLGYQDIRSFYHAFHRWTGSSPGKMLAEFRENQQRPVAPKPDDITLSE